jgi:hypothetical protein
MYLRMRGRPSFGVARGDAKGKEPEPLASLELLSKIAAAFLVLTYVTGYLIATTYLGSYGITTGASEALRARYIYIGFQYWMFVTIFGVVFRVIVLFFHVFGRPGSPRSRAKIGAQAGTLRAALGNLRWGIIVFLTLALFCIEILLLRLKSFGSFLPAQCIFLTCICIYQGTFYGEYSEHAGWSTLFGKKIVECIRWVYGPAIGALVVILMSCRAFWHHRFKIFRAHYGWTVWLVCIFVGVGAFIVVLGNENCSLLDGPAGRGLPWLASRPRAKLSAALRLAFQLTSGLLASGICGGFCWVALRVYRSDESLRLVMWLYFAALALALTSLSNVLLLNLMYREMKARQGLDKTISWKNWAMSGVAVVTLYLVSVFSFSYLIYPFVPVERAGGDYSTARPVLIHLIQSGSSCADPELGRELGATFYVLDEDADWTYMAPENSGNPDAEDPKRTNTGPQAWRWWAFCRQRFPKKAVDDDCRPEVFAVNRTCEAAMHDAPDPAEGRH